MSSTSTQGVNMGEVKAASATTDFNAIAAKYEVMQKKAWASQDVDVPQVQDLRDALDTYMSTHMKDASGVDAIKTKLKTSMDSMKVTVEAERTQGKKSNATWDADSAALEELLADLAPEGANTVYHPGGAAVSPSEDEEDGVSEVEENEAGKPEVQDIKTQTGGQTSAGAIAGDQSGQGWGTADLLDPATSRTYKGLSLDALMAKSDSLVSKTLKGQPDIVDAIRKVTQETGVPSGLLAAMVMQESNGRRETGSWNPGYGHAPGDQQYDWGVIQSPLWKFAGSTTAEKKRNAEDPYTNIKMFADEALDTYKETSSWGQAAQKWYTGSTADRLGGVTGGASEESNYVLNVFAHLGMGGRDYYPEGGY